MLSGLLIESITLAVVNTYTHHVDALRSLYAFKDLYVCPSNNQADPPKRKYTQSVGY